MATSKPQHGEVRSEFSTKDGVYRNIKASEHCRPSGHPLIGKELSNVQVSFVSCKDKDGQKEWVVFNAAKELYFYPYEGVGKVGGACRETTVSGRYSRSELRLNWKCLPGGKLAQPYPPPI